MEHCYYFPFVSITRHAADLVAEPCQCGVFFGMERRRNVTIWAHALHVQIVSLESAIKGHDKILYLYDFGGAKGCSHLRLHGARNARSEEVYSTE